ncbi:MAG: DUF3015 family protein [Bdellovibrio sp.]
MKYFTFIAVLVSGVIAYAEAPIGPAGCGLGNVMLQDQSQVLAATTNGTSGTQTFGISSGTSNCVDSSKRVQLENFVEANKVALNKEAARGEGTTLAGLNQVLGCSNNIAPVLKDHYKQIFNTESTKDISAKIAIVVENNPMSCGI